MSETLPFLERLLDAPGPSGFETRPARIWREEAEGVADEVRVDVSGNSVAALNEGGSPRIMLAGHVDEIGLMLTHVDDDGFLYFEGIGGWDPEVLVGQRVQILGRDRDVSGVIGKKPVHLMREGDREKPVKTRQLWIDVGAGSADEARELGVRVADPVVLDGPVVRLAGDRIASRSIDNRIGAYVVLEALRRVAGEALPAAVYAVATVQEEIARNGGGAGRSAFALDPQVALVVDVTFATDVPDVEKKELGDHEIGGGPVLSRGSAAHPRVFDLLVEVAEAEGIPHTVQAAPRSTRTDADDIRLARSGIPTGLISVPNRYMHTPNEVVSLGDLGRTVELIAAFIRRLDASTDFTPR